MSQTGRETRLAAAIVGGAATGTLSGLTGLGGTEFRLPLLLGPLRVRADAAPQLDRILSLMVVLGALATRWWADAWQLTAAALPVALGLWGGGMVGRRIGTGLEAELRKAPLHRFLPILLFVLACASFVIASPRPPTLSLPFGKAELLASCMGGIGIGMVRVITGTTGAELLLLAMMFPFGIPLHAAGTLTLLLILPDLVTDLRRHHTPEAFSQAGTGLPLAGGSLGGALMGGGLAGLIPEPLISSVLALAIVLAGLRIWMLQGDRDPARG